MRRTRGVPYSQAVALDEGSMDIDLLAASLRADSSDVGAFVESLASKLEDAVPDRVRVQRRRSGLLGRKLVARIALDAGSVRLELERGDRGGIETRCSRVSGGIVLKSEQIDTDAWLAALGEALATEAQRNERTRQALERLLIN
jgi:hypothetical protein